MSFAKIIKATEAQWKKSNPILSKEEFAFSIDTEDLRQGNGVNSWKELTPIVQQDNTEKYKNELLLCHQLIQETGNDDLIPQKENE